MADQADHSAQWESPLPTADARPSLRFVGEEASGTDDPAASRAAASGRATTDEVPRSGAPGLARIYLSVGDSVATGQARWFWFDMPLAQVDGWLSAGVARVRSQTVSDGYSIVPERALVAAGLLGVAFLLSTLAYVTARLGQQSATPTALGFFGMLVSGGLLLTAVVGLWEAIRGQ